MYVILISFLANLRTNHDIKKLMIEEFGESLWFVYPKEKSKSQLIYSTSVTKEDLIERVRRDNIKEFATVLKEELKSVKVSLKMLMM